MTEEPLLLSLDLGTTNCKGVAFDLAGAEVAHSEQSYPTYTPGAGAFEQRPQDWLTAIDVVLRRVAASLGTRSGDIAGLALSAWGPGLVLVDGEGQALNQASPTWQDARSAPHGERLVAALGTDWIGGGLPTTGFPAKLAWARAEWPELAERATWALGVKEFVLHWLTGTIATEASSGPYADEWPLGVIEEAGWHAHQLAPVLPATAVGGTLLPERAHRFGLTDGIPIVMGLNDGASATLGAGCHEAGDGVISLSTNGVYRLLLDAPPPAAACLESALFRYPFVEGLWVTGGFALSGGNALRWLVESVFADEGEMAYQALMDEASAVPAGGGGVSFLPYLVGRGSPSPNAEAGAAFVGLRLGHGRGHMVRAVLEGVGFALSDIQDSLGERGWQVDRLMVTGGGARNPLWRSILAGVLDRDVAYTRGDSNLGAAVLLAVALGVYEDFATAVAAMTPDDEAPGQKTAAADSAAYQAARAQYQAAVAALYGNRST